jgi:hypothetical protein
MTEKSFKAFLRDEAYFPPIEDEDEESQLFRMLHRWHEEIEDKYRSEKLCVEMLYRGLIAMRDRLRELRK